MRAHGPRVSCVVVTVLALCAALAACGGGSGGSGGKTVLRYSWWGNPDRAARTEKAIALFEKQHPGIEVQTSFSGYDTYIQKLATQAAGGDAPDVMQLDYRQINQYAQGGVLLDLGKQKDLRTGDFDKGLLGTGVVDDTQYAIPMGRGTQAVVYDAAQWRKAGVPEPRAGWTWKKWAWAMGRLAEATGKAGSVDPGHNEDWFEIWLRGQGKSLYTEDGGLGFTTGDLTRYWEWTSELRKRGAVSSAEQTTQLDGTVENQPLGRGKAVSDINWDAPSSGYEALLGKNPKLAPMPVAEDGTPGQYFKPSMFVGAAAKTSHPKAAVALIDFLMNDREAAEILGANRGIPANDRLRKRLIPELDGFDKVVADYQSGLEGKLKDPPQAPLQGDAALQRTLQRDYDQVSFGKMSPRKAAGQFVTAAKAELR
ncbi:ABC transporter substrate-binding protein [Streptomyces boncukensis]|uniref:Carbohydrate ABC transporter substrate-binding protein n=1 Tax=Streptomyces boncukensis TaxID=2711219 RepID=A0A6G4WVD7_9ACTN|nr:ABC transporter substrate-binding protein [Streptomyces boncukensis]NGO68577.1 carbohydrate ABC transporter substrate-binding protein [Streptomyces boncukensis]